MLAGIAVAAGLALEGRSEVAVGPHVVVNGGGPDQLVDARNSPTIVRNPRDPTNLAVVLRVDRPGFSAELYTSHDAGESWRMTALPLPEGLDRPFAPDAAFAPDGTLYVVYVNLEGNGNVPGSLWLARSDDGGRTLEQPTHIADELAFQARLAVDDAGVVHVTYLQATDVGTLQFVGPVAIVAVRSEDGGATFSAPVAVSDRDRPRVGAAVPVVGTDGTLLVVYQDFTSNVRDFGNLEGPPWPEPAALVATRSTDGGRTFSPGVVVDRDVVPAKRFLAFLPEFPSAAAGPDGELVVAWSDARHGDEDVFVRRSTDGAATWSEPVRVNDTPREDGASQYLPAVDIAPNGRVDVAFLDRRHDPDDELMDAYLGSSTDGGASFRNLRLSSASFDSRIGATVSPHIDIDFGTRIGIVSDDDSAWVAWTDTRLAEHPDHGRQDVVAAPVTLPRSSTPRVLALAGGLLAAAAAMIAALWLRRRRRTGR